MQLVSQFGFAVWFRPEREWSWFCGSVLHGFGSKGNTVGFAVGFSVWFRSLVSADSVFSGLVLAICSAVFLGLEIGSLNSSWECSSLKFVWQPGSILVWWFSTIFSSSAFGTFSL